MHAGRRRGRASTQITRGSGSIAMPDVFLMFLQRRYHLTAGCLHCTCIPYHVFILHSNVVLFHPRIRAISRSMQGPSTEILDANP